jgi:hypothetical protein
LNGQDLGGDEDAEAFVVAVAGKVVFRRRGDRDRLSRARNDAGEVHAAELAEDQVIHLVEGGLLKAQVAAPVQIVHEIGH